MPTPFTAEINLKIYVEKFIYCKFYVNLMLEDALIQKMVKGLRNVLILHYVSKSPLHGYDINKKFKEEFRIEYPSSLLYPVLRDLEKRGCLQSKWSKTGKRERRVYTITKKGLEVLILARSFMEEKRKRKLKTILED